jgi:pyrroloquinoline-quinone synthase
MSDSYHEHAAPNIIPLPAKWGEFISCEALDLLDQTPFLFRCRVGEITRRELRQFTVQQFFYAQHFTRYLCALLSNMTNEADRLELMENLIEEIGFRPSGNRPHYQVYRQMMLQMGIDPACEVANAATRHLIDSMLECCRNPDAMVGLGALCLGAEAIVPHLYSQIVRGFLSQKEPEDNLAFWRLHIEGDDAHALTMLKIIKREVEAHPLKRRRLMEAARGTIEARRTFFAALS